MQRGHAYLQSLSPYLGAIRYFNSTASRIYNQVGLKHSTGASKLTLRSESTNFFFEFFLLFLELLRKLEVFVFCGLCLLLRQFRKLLLSTSEGFLVWVLSIVRFGIRCSCFAASLLAFFPCLLRLLDGLCYGPFLGVDVLCQLLGDIKFELGIRVTSFFLQLLQLSLR